VRWLIGIALVVAACGSQPTEPSRSPAPAGSVAARAAAGTCPLAVAQLRALTDGLAGDLSNLSGPIKQKPFSATEAAVANFRVSATVTAFKDEGIAANLASCEATADLAPRVTKVLTTAVAAVEQAQAASITNASAQRAAGVKLLGLLPEVLALGKANEVAANTLGLPNDVAVVPGSADPGSSVGPAKTPPLTGGSSPAPAGGTWTDAANAYLNDTFATYRDVSARAAALSGTGTPTPSATPAELADGIRQALSGHLVYMDGHRARGCYSNAYATDRSLAGQWDALLETGVLPSDATPEGQAAAQGFEAAQTRTSSFLTQMASFFETCR
jgi:hypothetical protein